MSRAPIAWYRPPSEDEPDGEAVYGPRDPNMAGMDEGWLPAYAPGADGPEFTGVARRKLDELLASGWRVSGVSIEHTNQDGTVSRGAVTTGGMVLWWHAGQDATIAGLESCVGVLSALVDAQRQLLVEVEKVFGRDEYGIEFEDGDSEIIDKVREHIAATTEPPARKPLTAEQWLSVSRQARDAFFCCKQDSVLSQIDFAAHSAMRATEAAHGIK